MPLDDGDALGFGAGEEVDPEPADRAKAWSPDRSRRRVDVAPGFVGPVHAGRQSSLDGFERGGMGMCDDL